MRRLLFVVGAPRSGTTWTQLLLAQHPEVATAQETHLFAQYLGPLHEKWKADAADESDSRKGLPQVLSEDDFYGWCRGTAEAAIERIARRRGGASVIVEKTPSHGEWAPLILRLFPEAHFLHVIRDPRSVAASLRAAAQPGGFADFWAPRNVIDGARLWRELVEAARKIGGLTDRYRELRYEDIGPESLGEVLRWLGLEAHADFCRAAVEACRIDRMREKGAPTPWTEKRPREQFYRKGSRDGWRTELTASEAGAVERACAPLLAELGYSPEGNGHGRAALALHDGIARVHGALDWRLRALARRL